MRDYITRSGMLQIEPLDSHAAIAAAPHFGKVDSVSTRAISNRLAPPRLGWTLPAAVAVIALSVATSQRCNASDETSRAAVVRTVSPTDVDEIFAKWDKPTSPGMVVAVIHDGRIIYERGYGMASLEHDVPLSAESVFYIASTSKQFTAAAIGILALRGKLSLDDDVRKYIDELPDYGDLITIPHLVHHTRGLRDYLSLNAMAGNTTHGLTVDDAVRLIARQRELNFRPGEEYSYSNSGYVLMAAIVKRVSGKSLRAFAEENIFLPLGMKHSVFRDDNSLVIKHRATGHAPSVTGFRTNDPEIEAVGSGNLWTSARDLLLWDQNFHESKLDPGLVALLHSRGQLNNGRRLNYAFGLVIDEYRGLKRVHHGGAFAGFRTQMARFPEQRFTVICLSNLSNVDPSGLAMRVTDLYLADHLQAESTEPKTAEHTLPDELLRALAGTYRDPSSGSLWTFEGSSGALRLKRSAPWSVKLQSLGPTIFLGTGAVTGVRFTFVPSDERHARRVRVQAESGDARMLDYVEIVVPERDALAEYAGTYHSAEIGASFEVSAEADKLFVDGLSGRRRGLRPSIRDEFVTSSDVVRFERDEAGTISGLWYSTPRVRRLWFARQPDD